MKRNYILILASLFVFAFVSCESAKIPAGSQGEIPVAEEPAADSFIQEYERSTANVAVSLEDFNKDKARILEIISELSVVIDELDYAAWETYLDNESLLYWSKRPNLQKASTKLPVKGIRLGSLKDYFIHVFVPSRKGRSVDEIRYDTEVLVKAVQVTEESDIIYYNFNKVNGEWKLHLPELSD